MNLTNHSKRRMKQRCGWNKKTYERMAEKALKYGVKHSETKGNLHKFISGLYEVHKCKGKQIRIYGDKAYIFNKDVLITVIQIPSNLTKNMKAMIER